MQQKVKQANKQPRQNGFAKSLWLKLARKRMILKRKLESEQKLWELLNSGAISSGHSDTNATKAFLKPCPLINLK